MWDLVPWPRMEPGPPALGVQSSSHRTTREVPLKNSWIDCWVGGSTEMQMSWAWWIKSRTTVMGRAVFGEATTAEGLNWFLLRNTCRLLTYGIDGIQCPHRRPTVISVCCTLQLIWLCSSVCVYVCVCWREGKVFPKLGRLFKNNYMDNFSMWRKSQGKYF